MRDWCKYLSAQFCLQSEQLDAELWVQNLELWLLEVTDHLVVRDNAHEAVDMNTVNAPQDDCSQYGIKISVIAADVPQSYGDHEKDFDDNRYNPWEEEATVITFDAYD